MVNIESPFSVVLGAHVRRPPAVVVIADAGRRLFLRACRGLIHRTPLADSVTEVQKRDLKENHEIALALRKSFHRR